MKKKPAVLVLLALAGIAIAWSGYGGRLLRREKAPGPAHEIAQSSALDALLAAPPEELADAVGLAMRGIDLAQGENGRETWRLRAEWGTLRRASGLVEVHAPEVRYILDGADERGKNGHVLASADSGRVGSNRRFISMLGNARAEHNGKILEGPLAVFDSDSRVLTFPEGGTLNDAALSGRGGVLRWNMTSNILEGERGVEVVWVPFSDPADPHRNAAPEDPDGSELSR